MSLSHVAVIGAGAWGTALAQAAALAGRRVTLVARDPGFAARMAAERCNPVYLPEQALEDRVTVAGGFDALPDCDCALLVTPAQVSRQTLGVIGKRLVGIPVVLCAKGLETATLNRQSEILGETAPGALPLVLSGPSFAHDVAAGRPTAVSLAAGDAALGDEVARALSGPTLRLYVSGDLVGVELAGALKNVYALASGAVEGAGLGLSARSALIARAFAELSRLVVAMGGQATTLGGLAGLGDLTLSCTSAQSRNYAFGVALGQGRRVGDLLGPEAPLTEGIKTAPVAAALAHKHGVEVPLVEAVNRLIEGRLAIGEIVGQLMTRPLKRESED
jgi:glycerol-3-phosphate dehydrogenase (NAD(P)+)